MTRAAIYTRVSTDKQELNGTSLDTQAQLCRACAAERGYTVVAVERDAYSGAVYRERPGLLRLREQLRAGDLDVVVCYAVDRLSRNQAHLYILAEEIEDAGVRLEFVTEDFEDSAVGKFIRSAKAFAGEVEREKFAERSARGRKAKIASGKLQPGPYPLYGYQWADAERTRLVPDPDSAPVVQRIYADYLRGHTLRGICQRLRADGIPTARGAPIWRPQSVRRVLTHPNYSETAYGWLGRAFDSGAIRPEAIPLPAGVIEPIISQVEWDMVQRKIIEHHRRAGRPPYDPERTLLRGGFARCGLCGRAMSAMRATHGNYYYQCSSAHLLAEQRCNITISAKTLDAAVWSKLVELLERDDILAREMHRPSDERALADDRLRVERQLRTIETRQARLAQAMSMLEDPDAVAPLVAQMNHLAVTRRELAVELAGIARQEQAGAVLRDQLSAFRTWRQAVSQELAGLDYLGRRAFLELFEFSVTVFRRGSESRYVITSLLDLDRILSPRS